MRRKWYDEGDDDGMMRNVGDVFHNGSFLVCSFMINVYAGEGKK